MKIAAMRAFLALVLGLPASSPAVAQGLVAAPAASAADLYCPLQIEYVIPAGKSAGGALFAVGLRSLGERGAASGVLTFYAGDDRYDVSFKEAVAASVDERADIPAPIVVRFPAGVVPTAGYASMLGIPKILPCPVGFVWTPHAQRNYGDLFDRDGVIALAKTIAPIPAVPKPEPPPSCATPYADAKTLYAATADYPLGSKLNASHGTVVVAVRLSPLGEVLDASLDHPLDDQLLNTSALKAAERSSYIAEHFRCRAVYGRYFFKVRFTPP